MPSTLRATRGQLAVHQEVLRAAYTNRKSTEAVTYTPVLVTSVRRDGTVKAVRRPDGCTRPVTSPLPGGHRMLLVAAGRCDTDAVLRAAAAHTWEGTAAFRAYDTLQEVKELIDQHPATTTAKASRPPAPATLVVAHRKPSRFSPLAWTVALPAADDGVAGVILATDCRTRTRARTLAGWLESTGYDWTAGRAAISADDAVLALSTALCRDLRTAGGGHGLWPEEQPQTYTDLLTALHPRPQPPTTAP